MLSVTLKMWKSRITLEEQEDTLTAGSNISAHQFELLARAGRVV